MAETPRERAAREARSDWAEVALNYPQYRLEELPDMPLGDIRLLINTIRIRDLRMQRMMMQAFGAAQSQKGYNALSDKIKKAIGKHEEQL